MIAGPRQALLHCFTAADRNPSYGRLGGFRGPIAISPNLPRCNRLFEYVPHVRPNEIAAPSLRRAYGQENPDRGLYLSQRH